jgi:hypothetical protein
MDGTSAYSLLLLLLSFTRIFYFPSLHIPYLTRSFLIFLSLNVYVQPEEEAYSTAVIRHFRSGLLRIEDGMTLRGYLAEKLNCDPMRITKKYAGAACLGKRTFAFQDR